MIQENPYSNNHNANNNNTNHQNDKKELLQKRHYFILEQLQLISNQAPM